MTPKRYQLRKDAVAIVERHPWLFRDQLSSAANVFADGQWLRLVDGANQIVGYGIYEAEGAIAIRMLRTGTDAPNAAWLRSAVERAVAKREALARTTNAVRLVNGESDGIPAVVVDRFADTVVVASYSAGTDAIARFVAREVARIVAATNVILRPARRRRGPPPPTRVLRGSAPELVAVTEDALAFAVDLEAGHKTGTYLDLRGLRRAIATSDLRGKRVLNLFSYTGMLGRAAEAAGAAHITQVDTSQRALDFAAAHHVTDPAKHRFITADIFEWLPNLDPAEQFDLAIVDPPSMTSRMQQIPTVLAAYRRLYRAAERHVAADGMLVAACCTSRIDREVFKRTVGGSLGARFVHLRDLPPEPDHPASFREADYLKISWWRARPDE